MRTLAQPALPTERVGRYPKHPFLLTKQRPFLICPFMFAPVLPGETLSNMYMESRVVTDPIVNPIIGWKYEYFWFYVKMSDLLLDSVKQMFVDPTNTDLSASQGIGADSTQFFTAKGGVPWAERCYERIVETYFRDAGESYTDYNVDGLAVAQIRDTLWMNSLTDESEMPEGAAISSATDAGDLDRLMEAYQTLQSLNMAQMTYEDFLRSYGINVPEARIGEPEKIWHISDWQYPSNTIDPTDGQPTSAVSWVFKKGTNYKNKRFFKEPGFIMGVTVCRPKVYLGGQFGNASAHLSRAWDWLPAYLPPEMVSTRLKHFAAGTGPLGDRSGTGNGTESEYWFDVADIFVHGDQWRDFNLPNTVAGDGATHTFGTPAWGLGEDVMSLKYVGSATMAAMFVDTTTARNIRSDGMVSLDIKGKVVDVTQTGFDFDRAS